MACLPHMASFAHAQSMCVCVCKLACVFVQIIFSWACARACVHLCMSVQTISRGCACERVCADHLLGVHVRACVCMQASGCHPDAAVFNSMMEVLWQSGVIFAQVRLHPLLKVDLMIPVL